MKNTWNSSDPELQRRCVDAVIARVDDIGDSSAGIIAAQDIIDIVTEHLAPEIYNNGVSDAQKMIVAKMTDLEIELDGLRRSS
ncbi:MAG: DUF2164 family protein [Patescibacteria group bacterium]